MAQKTREQILELVLPLIKNSKSPNHEIAITGGSLATLLGLDWAENFQGGKSAAQLEAEELRAENDRLRAQLAAAPTAPVVDAPVAQIPVAEIPVEQPPAAAPIVEETKPAIAETPLPSETLLPGENAAIDSPGSGVAGLD